MKKNWPTILILTATIILGGIAVFTAFKLYQIGQEPVAPSAPKPAPAVEIPEQFSAEPAAAPECTLEFDIEAEETPTPTPTSTSTPTPTPTPPTDCYDECDKDADCSGDLYCQDVSGTNRCVNPDCPTETDCECPGPTNTPTPITPTPPPGATATPTPTPQPELPEVGLSLPTFGAVAGGFLLIILSLILAL